MRKLVWVRTLVSVSTREKRQPPERKRARTTRGREPLQREEETNPREGETRTPREGEKKPPEGENPFAREERQPQRGRKEKVQLSKDSIDRLHMIRTW